MEDPQTPGATESDAAKGPVTPGDAPRAGAAVAAQAKQRKIEFFDSDGLGRPADFGLKRRMAKVRLFAIGGAVALVALGLAMWLLGQAVALAALPAGLILAGLILAAVLWLTGKGRVRWLALTALAFAIGLAPHALFVIVYNLAASLGGHDDPAYLPSLWGPLDAYEDGVLWLHAHLQPWFHGGDLILFGAACAAVIAGLILASLWAARLKAGARLAVGVAETLVLGVLATAVFSQIAIGQWSPGLYGPRLDADLAWLEQARTRTFLLERLTQTVRADAPAIRAAYGPTIAAAVQAVQTHPPAHAAAAARELGWDYAAAVGAAGRTQSGIEHVDPGEAPDRQIRLPDRPAVLAAERDIALQKTRFDTALRTLVGAVTDAIGRPPTGAPAADAFVDAFASGLIDAPFGQLTGRFDSTFGDRLAERLARADSAPGHPLSRAMARSLTPTLLPADAQRFNPTSIGQVLAGERTTDEGVETPIEALIEKEVRQAMQSRSSAS